MEITPFPKKSNPGVFMFLGLGRLSRIVVAHLRRLSCDRLMESVKQSRGAENLGGGGETTVNGLDEIRAVEGLLQRLDGP